MPAGIKKVVAQGVPSACLEVKSIVFPHFGRYNVIVCKKYFKRW
jgi:hypothetical protein